MMHARQTLASFCASLDAPVPAHVVRLGRRFFYDPAKLEELAKLHRWEAHSLGMFLGEERGGFRPTSALLDLLAPHCPRSVVVTEKAGWLFLCGRDILMDGVLTMQDTSVGSFAIVRDQSNHVLGVVKIAAPHEPKFHAKVFGKHVIDRGEYLRRERT